MLKYNDYVYEIKDKDPKKRETSDIRSHINFKFNTKTSAYVKLLHTAFVHLFTS